jgi:hypothetical protein
MLNSKKGAQNFSGLRDGGLKCIKHLNIRVGNIEIFEINIGENFSKFRNKYFEILIFKFRNKNFEILKFRNFRKISKF